MNKKVIKYLSWIILIALVLILIPMKQSNAARQVTFEQFRKSRNYFCLNEGYPYRATEEFSSETEITQDDFESPDGNTVDTDILKYIITEAANNPEYAIRQSISGYVPQRAIWNLVNNVESQEAGELVNMAKAYDEVVSKIVYPPKIKQLENRKFAVYYSQATVEGQTYSNLISVSPNYSHSDPQTVQETGYTHRIVYTVDDDITTTNVSVRYETRSAKLYHLASDTIIMGQQTKLVDSSGITRFIKYDLNRNRYICMCYLQLSGEFKPSRYK